MHSTPGAAAGTTATPPVEVVSWVTTFVGGDGSALCGACTTNRWPPEQPCARCCAASPRFPDLHRAPWNGVALGEHIEVLVNDAVLDVHHTLDSRLAPGDRLALLGQYMGG